MKTFNKKGDQGQTSLLFGCRTDKDNPRCEAYGTLDEAISTLGIARNHVTKEKVKEIILKVQKELFTVGAELATDKADYDKFTTTFTPITGEMVTALEEWMAGPSPLRNDRPKARILLGYWHILAGNMELARSVLRGLVNDPVLGLGARSLLDHRL